MSGAWLQKFRLDGQLALVTGASSGLGQHFAGVLAQAGARVAVAARRVDKLQSLVEGIQRAGGDAMAVALDVGDAFLAIEIADKVVIRVQKNAVAAVLPKGTLKSA